MIRSVVLWVFLTISVFVLCTNVVIALWPYHAGSFNLESTTAIVGSFLALVGVVVSLIIQYENRISHTVDVSPNNSDVFLKSWGALQAEFRDLLDSGDAVIQPNRYLEKGSPQHRDFLVVLNFWGRIATLYREGAIDRSMAKKMYKFGFLRFVNFFWPYIEAKREPGIYDDTEFLKNEWSNK